MINRFICLFLVLLVSMPAIANTQDKAIKVIVNDLTLYLPGNWQHWVDNPEHGHVGYRDTANGLQLFIAVHDVEIMKFYNDTLSNFELARAAYERDIDHWVDGDENQIKQILEDTTANYLIWGLQHPEEKNVILYGAKNGKIVGLNLIKTSEGNMDTDRAWVLLQKIFTK